MAELLLVDDEPAIQHAFRRAFQRDDLKLRMAGSAAEAVAEFHRLRPDVVVLDVRLPDATGLETFRRLRDLDARIPVIVITGHGTTELAIQAIKEGAFEYLLKPLELPQLREALDRAFRSSAAMRTPAAMPEVEEACFDVFVGRTVESDGRTDFFIELSKEVLAALAATGIPLRMTLAGVPR